MASFLCVDADALILLRRWQIECDTGVAAVRTVPQLHSGVGDARYSRQLSTTNIGVHDDGVLVLVVAALAVGLHKKVTNYRLLLYLVFYWPEHGLSPH